MRSSPETIVALAKSVSAKESREASAKLAPGEYEVKALVLIQGTIKKGADYEQEIVAKADPWALLGAALSRLNRVTVESLVRAAEDLSSAEIKEIKEQTKVAMGAVKAPTLTQCNGKVSTNLQVGGVIEATETDTATVTVAVSKLLADLAS